MSASPTRDRGHLASPSLGVLGIVYGDIGTCPLYASRGAIHATGGQAADAAGVLGNLSMVFWALMLVVSLTYLAVVVRADNHREGGILALTAAHPRATTAIRLPARRNEPAPGRGTLVDRRHRIWSTAWGPRHAHPRPYSAGRQSARNRYPRETVTSAGRRGPPSRRRTGRPVAAGPHVSVGLGGGYALVSSR